MLVSVLNCSGTAGDSDGQLGKAGVPRPYSDPHLLTSSRLVAPRHAVNTGLAALPTRPAEVWKSYKTKEVLPGLVSHQLTQSQLTI